MKTRKPRLSKDHLDALREIVGGADIGGYHLAGKLREIERLRPDCITITKVMGVYNVMDKLPYFGAIPTKAGLKLLGLSTQ